MRTNSPISDPEPVTPIPTPRKKPQKVSEWEKLGKSGQYPKVNAELEKIKKDLQRAVPGGTGLSKAEQLRRWDSAVLGIEVIERIQAAVALAIEKRK